MKTSINEIKSYRTKDGSMIRELMHPVHHGSRNLSFAEAEVEPGRTTDLHCHLVSEEIYHITQGEGMMTLGDEQFAVNPGDTVCIQPGTSHRILNTGKKTLRILCSCAPPYSHSDTEII